mmetsp:Transcript_22506/g.59138  ORF Transcript_22506/g.59138 Transcript_22506/m.59138 type:complete len:468 (-) Transcript_22506:27-1430(-)
MLCKANTCQQPPVNANGPRSGNPDTPRPRRGAPAARRRLRSRLLRPSPAVGAAERAPPSELSCARRASRALRAAVVALRHEGHLGDRDLLRLLAHRHLQLGAHLVELGLDVAHADALLEARAERAASDDAHDRPVGAEDLGALARRRACVDDEAGALAARRLVLQFGQNPLGADKAGGVGSPRLGDAPEQRALDGRGRVVQVVAVEAEAGLEAERVARAEADGPHLLVRQHRVPQPDHLVLGAGALGNRNLEAVLAGVAAAADEAIDPTDRERLGGHESHLREVFRHEALQHLRRLGALEREDAIVRQSLQRNVAASRDELVHVLLEVREVLLLVARVDHHVEVVASVGDDAIVDDAAVLVRDHRERAHPLGQSLQVSAAHLLHEGDAVGAPQDDAEHVRHVEETGVRPAVQVRIDDARRILHGHVPSTERHHLAAQRDMRLVERRLTQRAVGRGREPAHVAADAQR